MLKSGDLVISSWSVMASINMNRNSVLSDVLMKYITFRSCTISYGNTCQYTFVNAVTTSMKVMQQPTHIHKIKYLFFFVGKCLFAK